jgi:hypothetical protein
MYFSRVFVEVASERGRPEGGALGAAGASPEPGAGVLVGVDALQEGVELVDGRRDVAAPHRHLKGVAELLCELLSQVGELEAGVRPRDRHQAVRSLGVQRRPPRLGRGSGISGHRTLAGRQHLLDGVAGHVGDVVALPGGLGATERRDGGGIRHDAS